MSRSRYFGLLDCRALGAGALAAALSSCAPPAPKPVVLAPAHVVRVVAPEAAKPATPVAAAPAGPAFRLRSVVLYQPNDVLTARLGGDAQPFAGYVRRVERHVSSALAGRKAPGFSAAVVIAVKPDGEVHAWLVTRRKLPPGLAGDVTAAAEAAPPVDVQGGPIAFAIVFDAFGGGGPPVVDRAHPIPIPPEWRQGASASGLTTDGPPTAPE